MLVTVFTISLIFKIGISFLRRFLIELFNMLSVIFLTSEIKFATYKLQLLKCISFEEPLLHFHNFFPCNAMTSCLPLLTWQYKPIQLLPYRKGN